MSTKEMKLLISALGEEAAKELQRPAEPRDVMRQFCRAMSVRKGRLIELKFYSFPPDAGVSGLCLDLGDRSIIVVEEATASEAQLVIVGHELKHADMGTGHHAAGMPAAARTHGTLQQPEAVRRALQQILDEYDLTSEAVLTVSARDHCADEHEIDAETFGLLFAAAVRPWIRGRYAQGPVSDATVEGRINLSLLSRGGTLL
ncbi:hypothetical protein [Streptomyces hokutonensis]|uniref:hypothetical protein n=1 Tax=Streptomyces hokutonensis TaxID=1306990 RepID=UPI00037C4C2A|nr:hypothetical protein [Streptomyces hokutonensis]